MYSTLLHCSDLMPFFSSVTVATSGRADLMSTPPANMAAPVTDKTTIVDNLIPPPTQTLEDLPRPNRGNRPAATSGAALVTGTNS
jgi:hypothetical protein